MKQPNRKISRANYTAAVRQNQKICIDYCKSSKGTIRIIPQLFEGHIEQFYHLLFDILLPLSLVLDQTPSKVNFTIQELGVLTPMLLKVFGERVKIKPLSESKPNEEQIILMGMTPNEMNVEGADLDILIERFFNKLKIEKSEKPNKIILLERGPPDPYYVTNTRFHSSGAPRRSIKNHKELENLIGSKVKPTYEFHNLTLKNMSIEDQVRMFNSAALVIGQHGAALSNMMWMPKESTVFELGHISKTYFTRLSKVMNHKYSVIDYGERHITVDRDDIYQRLLDNPDTRKFFF